jgi:hypothetical protein
MARIIVTEYISIDGVIEAPAGVEDHEHVDKKRLRLVDTNKGREPR